jgi:hypothetical protein
MRITQQEASLPQKRAPQVFLSKDPAQPASETAISKTGFSIRINSVNLSIYS